MVGFTVHGSDIDREVCKIRDIMHKMGIKNATRTDVIRFLLAQRDHSDIIRKKIKENLKIIR